jgi:hypothetical protein
MWQLVAFGNLFMSALSLSVKSAEAVRVFIEAYTKKAKISQDQRNKTTSKLEVLLQKVLS